MKLLGFVNQCPAMTATGKKQVFHAVRSSRKARLRRRSPASSIATWPGSVSRSTALVVYPLRHTFIDQAWTAGILDQEISIIVGYDRATLSGRYGTAREGALKRRAEIVEAVLPIFIRALTGLLLPTSGLSAISRFSSGALAIP